MHTSVMKTSNLEMRKDEDTNIQARLHLLPTGENFLKAIISGKLILAHDGELGSGNGPERGNRLRDALEGSTKWHDLTADLKV